MNKLPIATRIQILSMLCEGSSMRSITRITGVSINTVSKLLEDAGEVCAAFHDEHVRGVKAKRVQVDEIWSFTYAKQKNVPDHLKGDKEVGDTWTWIAIDAQSKLVPCWHIGKRNATDAYWFINDMKERLASRVQLTSDGLKSYLEAVEGAFGADIDYAQLVKLYGNEIPNDQLPMQIAARDGRSLNGVKFAIAREDGHVIRLLEYATPLFDEKGERRRLGTGKR